MAETPALPRLGHSEDAAVICAQAELALISKRRSRLFSRFRKVSTQSARAPSPERPSTPERSDSLVQETELKRNASQEELLSKDVYDWAVLFENQRGITIFSIPYYSSAGLLPKDPKPWTLPTSEKPGHHGRTENLPTSLDTYSLPDPEWRWVSKSWMVDMKNDGDVQHDGFEYNTFFRQHGWSANVNAFSFVRRRRWIRLMVRPARGSNAPTDDGDGGSHLPHSTNPPHDADHQGPVWRGDEGDWDRCHAALRKLSRDGKKLELWHKWLSVEEDLPRRMPKGKQWTEDTTPEEELDQDETHSIMMTEEPFPVDTTPARIEYVRPVLREHLQDILSLFIYPEKRAQFIELLEQAGLGNEVGARERKNSQFWSRATNSATQLAPTSPDSSP